MRVPCSLIAAAAALAAGAASAESVTYYYVGAPARISNFPAGDRPLFNTGTLRIEGDVRGLAGRTIDVESGFPPAGLGDVSFRFSLDRFVDQDFFPGFDATLSFDSELGISDWNIRDADTVNPSFGFAVVKGFGDSLRRTDNFVDVDDRIASTVLKEKGYREGTPAYRELYCGSWAGADAPGCSGNFLWSLLLRSEGSGTWVRDDPDAYASLVVANTALALAQPPASYHDIPPAPIPLSPSWMFMALGMASAGAVLRGGRRAAAR